jgi:hypothetical protein
MVKTRAALASLSKDWLGARRVKSSSLGFAYTMASIWLLRGRGHAVKTSRAACGE